MAEQTKVTEIGTGQVDGKVYVKKRIALVNPPKQDVIGRTRKMFNRADVALAKAEYRLAVIEGRNLTNT